MTFRSVVLCTLVAFSSPALAQDRAITAGVSTSAGFLGFEYVRHAEDAPFGYALGVGAAGLGMRGQYRISVTPTGFGFVTRYVSLGALLCPWQFGQVNTPAVLAAEYGTEIVLERSVYASLGAGLGVPVGGDVGGYALLPSLRLLVGWGGHSGTGGHDTSRR